MQIFKIFKKKLSESYLIEQEINDYAVKNNLTITKISTTSCDATSSVEYLVVSVVFWKKEHMDDMQ